jgi:hypothetical protein
MPAPLPPAAKQISVKFSGPEARAIEEYALSCNISTAAAIRTIVNTWLSDPKLGHERAAIRHGIREAALTGYRELRIGAERVLHEVLAKLEALERQVYRSKYRDNTLTDADRATDLVHEMDADGSFVEIDRERARTARRRTPSQRDAELTQPTPALHSPELRDAIDVAEGGDTLDADDKTDDPTGAT